MKKSFSKVIVAIITLFALCTGLFACGTTGGWDSSSVTLKNWGSVVSSYGFVAETDNYIYYINGVGENTSDNTFGAPVKGSLMAANKSNLSETCIVVPKLFVATDYNAGLFLNGDYVYYGTPCTSLDSSGAVANTLMTFAKTKLDGTETEEFFTTSSLSVQYRFVADADGKVHIVYHDSDNARLVDYNTDTKTELVIAEVNEQAETESLDTCYFMREDGVDGAVVFFTTKVYKTAFNQAEKDALGTSYNRATASYNRVYGYKVGDAKNGDVAGVKVLDGNKGEGVFVTYAISLVKDEYVFVTETNSNSMVDVKTFMLSAEELYALNNAEIPAEKAVLETAIVAETSVIVSPTEAYFVKDGYIIKTTNVFGFQTLVQEKVAKAEKASTLYFVEGDYIYYANSDNALARIKIANVDEDDDNQINEQLVSDGSINTAWYKPEKVGNKVFYVSTSTVGVSYVHYTAFDADVVEEKDENDEVTARKLVGTVLVGKMNDADVAQVFAAKVDNITAALDSGKLVYNVDGEEKMLELEEAVAAYNALTDAQKGLASQDSVNLLNKYVKAMELSKKLLALDGFDVADETTKQGLRTAYEEAKAMIDEIDASSEYDVVEIRSLTIGNGNWFYQEANEYFTAE